MSFSGIVRISNISDFIEPSQKCILPIEGKAISNQRLVSVHSPTPTVSSNSNKIKISLNDCLACSGCVTTAETVLIESQTTKQMLAGIETAIYSIVAISPQSLCSLSAKFDMSILEMTKLLTDFFKSKGANFIVDMSFARILSRRLFYEEFCREMIVQKQDVSESKTILTGVCPGFVCYAEKTHGDLLVPLLSSIRSPQAIMAQLVKNFLKEKLSARFEDIFLVCVQPCFDKKLEASRTDFQIDKQREVDSVITALELEPLLTEFIRNFQIDIKGQQIKLLPEFEWLHSFERGIVLGDHDTETSGGYTEYIVRHLIKENNGLLIKREKIANDFERVDVEINAENSDQNGQKYCVSLGKAYGFRNIQNLVQRIKKNKLRMHFVEVMACPSGCGNGGGQIRAEKAEMRTQLHAKVHANYAQLGSNEPHEEQWARIEEEWTKFEPFWRDVLMHTNYRKIRADSFPNTAYLLNNW